jgi:uncharacterized protein YhbP (UPF0306 family)
MAITRRELLEFLRNQRWAVEASVAPAGAPQAALVGFVANERLELFFDTLGTTRKLQNLRRNPKIALVIGGWTPGDERTLQYEGLADEPRGAELEQLKALYFARFPDGRERQTWPSLVYVRARPTWMRFSDYNRDPPEIVEFQAEQLR